MGIGHTWQVWGAQSRTIIAFCCVMDAQLRQPAANQDQREALLRSSIPTFKQRWLLATFEFFPPVEILQVYVVCGISCLQALCGTQAAEDSFKTPRHDRAFSSLHAPLPRGRQATSHEPFRQLSSGLKIPGVFREMISTQFNRGRAQKGLGPVGVGWPRQQFSWRGLGLQAAALSCEPKRWQGQS